MKKLILYNNNLEKELLDVLIILEDESIKIIFKIVKCIFDIKLLFKFNEVLSLEMLNLVNYCLN